MSNCTSCRTAREIIKGRVTNMIAKFSSEESRRQHYIDNVTHTFKLYKEKLVPYNWFGFVHRMSCSEFKIYFEEDLNEYLTDELIKETLRYRFNSEHGLLYKVLIDKFNTK